ncbi:MAG: putative Ig domain-containing protein [Kiritimatiellae bacterium]|nr:putative Ig domain-containing protein [Kiritimatiellia bacterium]
MTVTAKGLPDGLKVDKTSGVISGKPKAAGSFKATVTVKTAAGNTIKFKVKIVARDGVQLWENGPYWATTNIGADNPWDYGLYFWWGDTKGYSPSSDGKFSFNFDIDNDAIYTHGKYPSEMRKEGWLAYIANASPLTPEHDAAHVQWGEQWRMPTESELSYLGSSEYCDRKWTEVNGVYGCIVSGKGDYASASIFLPATGRGDGTSLGSAGKYGWYWSSETDGYPMDGEFGSWALYFKQESKKTVFGRTSDPYRELGLAIRPVKAK